MQKSRRGKPLSPEDQAYLERVKAEIRAALPEASRKPVARFTAAAVGASRRLDARADHRDDRTLQVRRRRTLR